MNDNIMNTQWSKKEEEKKPLDRLTILEALLSNKGDKGEPGKNSIHKGKNPPPNPEEGDVWCKN